MKPKLDAHSEAILEEYRSKLPVFEDLSARATKEIKEMLASAGIIVAAVESRVKTESSLAGKLELKGSKYSSISDITDIVGLRVITFYIDDVDKVASLIERLFEIDWENSVDKRKLHEIDSFGYLSLHYICSYKGSDIRFEVQLRTVLQHAWANMNHDTGYKALVASGNLDDVLLDGDTFRSYLDLGPFDTLNRKIAAVNQAEIQEVSLMPYLPVFKNIGCKTLGDIDRIIKKYSDGAFQIACYQLGLTDLDIIASSLGPQDLCIAFLLKSGIGKAGIRMLFDALNGPSEGNDMIAEMLMEQAQDLPFMNQ